jgi:glycine cleavage system aminomethyltransferase T
VSADPVALGFVPPDLASRAQQLNLMVRGKPLLAEVFKLPFISKSFKK